MGLMNRLRGQKTSLDENEQPWPSNDNTRAPDGASSPPDVDKRDPSSSDSPVHYINLRVVMMGLIVSMGGFIFGYDTGQISGLLQMADFLARFGDTTGADGSPAFSNVRSGTIVGLLSIGTLVGAIIAAPVANRFGRKYSIVFWNVIFCVGMIVQITTSYTWYQIALGRLVAGLGVGALSVLTPMYQSETAPRQVRGALVSCYQLFITAGIFLADAVNYGTNMDVGSRSWRLPMGLSFIWSFLMAVGVLFLPESPRWDFRKGNTEKATATFAKSYGVHHTHPQVAQEIREIESKLAAERERPSHKWYDAFTGPAMFRRILLGIVLQALQQLTGANFFFYYGTTIFSAVGLVNSFITALILGAVNFGCTFLGLYVVEHFGRRRSLIFGSLWTSICFFIFASIGSYVLNPTNPASTPAAGYVMIVFACLFIFGYAITWGPIIWALIGEIYPGRYRALCMGIATSSNWTWNFLIAFFTPFITAKIGFKYGYLFAACNLTGAVVVYFFVCESQGRTLEAIDTMYVLGVKPWKSSKWEPPEELVTTESQVAPPAADSRKDQPWDAQVGRQERA